MKALGKNAVYPIALVVAFAIDAGLQMLRDATKVGNLFTTEEGRQLVRTHVEINEAHDAGVMSHSEWEKEMSVLTNLYTNFHKK